MKRIAWSMLLALSTAAAVGCEDKPLEPITATTVDYDQFDKAVKSHKGKVVLIDVWFRGCAPCVKKFPHLVDLHNKYKAEGLVCISLNNQDLDPKDKPKVEKFLTERKATFPQYLLDDSVENWKKWNKQYPTDVTPSVMLFNRKGERVKVNEEPKEAEVEEDVKKLLAEK